MAGKLKNAVLLVAGTIFAVLQATSTSAREAYWQGDTSSSWPVATNWFVVGAPNGGAFIPQVASGINARAIMGTDSPNGVLNSFDAPFGTPVVSSTVPTVGGTYLGLRELDFLVSPPEFVNPEPGSGQLVGSLTIAPGGVLNNVSTSDNGADGRVVVGADGRGFLTMTGGTLTGTALVVDGEDFTGDSLGNSMLDLSGSAVVDILNPSSPSIGTATFNRRLRIEGPNVDFNTSGRIRLNSSNTYDAIITSSTAHSPLKSDTSAIVGGALNIEFSGAGASGHALGQTWDLVDAGVGLAGNFNNLGPGGAVDVAGLASPPPVGSAYRVQRAENGGRKQVQLVYDAVLVLEVNRDTGELTITNPLSGSLGMDGYSINSSLGSLVSTYHGISGTTPTPPSPNWEKYGLSENALTEVINDPNSASTEFDLSSGAPVPLGNGFDRLAVAGDINNFGVDGEDIRFTYTRPGVTSPIQGQVVYVGAKFENNLVLKVDPNTGEAVLKNDSMETLTFDGYSIVSETGDLSGAGFTGLGGSWASSPATGEALSQTNLFNSTTLAPGEEVAIGDISTSGFTTDEAQAGLGMEFILATSLIGGPTGGDYNGDGVVDAIDYAVWRENLGAAISLDNENPDALTPGVVDQEDFEYWLANFGAQGGGNVPEGTFRVGSILFEEFSGASSAFQGAAAPEPGALWLLAGALVAALTSRHRNNRPAPVYCFATALPPHTEGAKAMACGLKASLLVAVCLAVVASATISLADTQGIPLINSDFEQPGPPGEKTLAFDEAGVPNGAIPGWTFPGPGVENFGHEDQLGDSGTEGGGAPGNAMLLSTLDGVAYQTSSFNVIDIPATQKYSLSFDAFDIYTIDENGSTFEESQNQLQARLYYLEADGTTRTTIGSSLVVDGLSTDVTKYTIEFIGGDAALTPALGRPIGVEFDITSDIYNPLVAHSWAHFDNVVLQIAGLQQGDFDGDGDIDLDDYDVVVAHQQQASFFSAEGELTGDGMVDLNDFRAFKNIFATTASASGGSPIDTPEPASFLLVGLCGALLFVRRLKPSPHCAGLLALIAGGLLAGNASATVFYYDPFLIGTNPAAGEYSEGLLTGQEPTPGPTAFFDGPWQERAGGEGASNGQVKAAPGLSFLGAEAFGGSIGPVPDPETFDSTTRVGRYLATESRFTSTTTGTYYLSWLHDFGTIAEDADPFDRNAMGHRAVEFWSDAGSIGVDADISMLLGYLGYQDPFAQEPNAARMVVNVDGQGHQIIENSPSSFVEDGATHLIVLRLDLSDQEGEDTVSVYLDPVSLVEPDLAGASFSGVDFTLGSLGIAQFAGAGGRLPSFDELRIADTWAEAVPPFPLPGDTDNDGDVDLDDYQNIVSHMNQRVTTALEGDVAKADGTQGADGIVTIADYRIWRDNRTDLGVAASGAQFPAPEPSALALILLCGSGLVGSTYRSRR